MPVHGDIPASNVVTGSGAISNLTASVESGDDLAKALLALKPLAETLADDEKFTVESSLDLMIRAAIDPSVPQEQVTQAAKEIAEKSAAVWERVKAIRQSIPEPAASSTVGLGIKEADEWWAASQSPHP